MATTIQIEKEVKQKLFQLKLAFSQKLGRSVNYNEVIEELITLHQEKFIETDIYQKIRDLANKFDKKLYDEYRQGKLKDLNQEEQNYPISQTKKNLMKEKLIDVIQQRPSIVLDTGI